MTEHSHTTQAPIEVHKHNTLGHILRYAVPSRVKKDSHLKPTLQRTFDAIGDKGDVSHQREYMLFPVGSKTYDELRSFKIPPHIVDPLKIKDLTLAELDPDGAIRKWLLEQKITLNHYLGRKHLQTDKRYYELILDNLFPEQKSSPELYAKYEAVLRNDYVDGFIMYAHGIFCATRKNDDEYFLKDRFFTAILDKYLRPELNIANLCFFIRDKQKAEEDLVKEVVDDPNRITRAFQEAESIWFPIPPIVYEEDLKELSFDPHVLQAIHQISGATEDLDELQSKLKNINFVDPDGSFRKLLFSYFDRMNAFLYSKNDGVLYIRKIFNALYPACADAEKSFREYEVQLRTAYFSGFIQNITRELPLSMRDHFTRISNLVVSMAAECAPGYDDAQDETPIARERLPLQQKIEESLERKKELLAQHLKPIIIKELPNQSLELILSNIKKHLDLKEGDASKEYKFYTKKIDELYLNFYTEQKNGKWTILTFVEDLYERPNDMSLSQFYALHEAEARKLILTALINQIGDEKTKKLLNIYVDKKDRSLKAKHHKASQKEFKKLMRTLGRFADGVRYVDKEGIFLEYKYHAIHDVSKQIETALHQAYLGHRLLSPGEKRDLKYRCLGLVDDEMKFILKKRMTSLVFKHLAKHFAEWRVKLANLFKAVWATSDSSALTEDGRPASPSSTSTRSSLDSENDTKAKVEETPARSFYRWQKVESTFDDTLGNASSEEKEKPHSRKTIKAN